MKKLLSVIGLVALLAFFVLGAPTTSFAAPRQSTHQFIHVCPAPPTGYARCHAILVTGFASSSPSGYNPADLQSAYKLPSSTAGSGQTVAIVDAYDDPNAESDLGVYRSQFGLPPCTTANGCFKKVDQNGGTNYPRANGGWAQEISLDLDMVSAVCPNCHIILVEATTNSLTNLGTAVNEAAKLGANAISNSYGGGEFSSETSYDTSYYRHPGIVVTASAGDSGYGVEYPAASQYVTAVGGTTLTKASNTRGWSETVWSGTGSGCSAYEPKPSWQTDTGCSHRTVGDVAADADPNTGVSVYDSYKYQGLSGWLVFGGTSVASPIIASVYALAGNSSSVTYGSYPYSHTSSLFDVTSGSNGSCGGSYLCTGEVGYDGPTGNGTPDGTGGF
ncbi:MAG TPA: S53 family peptidase [Ktedonobacteraceae bacterium]|nr:S53 family peptidase [Ktedonobacteraceae bacterium]